ncbi:hypothetical protein [Pseudolysinimonas sp.]|jgi:hypothetical protein|uniref:hypothetical protein n=1 Tax=Pseudolysinimonas sp. TaxID=2680009 RepID=UPI00378454E0
MPQQCRVCAHEERATIDAALLTTTVTEVWATLAQPLNDFSASSLWRHARSHVRGRTALAGLAIDLDAPGDHIAALARHTALLERIAQDANETGDRSVAIRATAEARTSRLAILDLLGERADDLGREFDNWVDLMSAIVDAIHAQPLPVLAWADALEAAGRHSDLVADLRAVAAQPPTK